MSGRPHRSRSLVPCSRPLEPEIADAAHVSPDSHKPLRGRARLVVQTGSVALPTRRSPTSLWRARARSGSPDPVFLPRSHDDPIPRHAHSERSCSLSRPDRIRRPPYPTLAHLRAERASCNCRASPRPACQDQLRVAGREWQPQSRLRQDLRQDHRERRSPDLRSWLAAKP